MSASKSALRVAVAVKSPYSDSALARLIDRVVPRSRPSVGGLTGNTPKFLYRSTRLPVVGPWKVLNDHDLLVILRVILLTAPPPEVHVHRILDRPRPVVALDGRNVQGPTKSRSLPAVLHGAGIGTRWSCWSRDTCRLPLPGCRSLRRRTGRGERSSSRYPLALPLMYCLRNCDSGDIKRSSIGCQWTPSCSIWVCDRLRVASTVSFASGPSTA